MYMYNAYCVTKNIVLPHRYNKSFFVHFLKIKSQDTAQSFIGMSLVHIYKIKLESFHSFSSITLAMIYITLVYFTKLI